MAKQTTKPSKQKPKRILAHVWLDPATVARVDEFAEEEGRKRANMLARLVEEALKARG